MIESELAQKRQSFTFGMFLVFALLVLITEHTKGCIVPERRTKFGDFAKRYKCMVYKSFNKVQAPFYHLP